MNDKRRRTWRDGVFAGRGTLLAVPAGALVLCGRPTAESTRRWLPLAFLGEALRCWAVGYSGVTTRAGEVTAPRLATAGPYAYVRNPLYAGNVVTAVGFAFAFTGDVPLLRRALLIFGGIGTMLAVYAIIVPLEEEYLRATFGADFETYAARVPRAFPRLTAAAGADRAPDPAARYDPGVIAHAETRTFLSFAAMLLALCLKLRFRRGP